MEPQRGCLVDSDVSLSVARVCMWPSEHEPPVALIMSVDSASATAIDASIPPIEYPPISAAAQSAGRVSIVGFGSLLSLRSAESTFGSDAISHFRPALITGWRRIFAHVAPIFIERGIADVKTKEMSSLSVEPCEGAELRVSVFEVRACAIMQLCSRCQASEDSLIVLFLCFHALSSSDSLVWPACILRARDGVSMDPSARLPAA